MTKTGVEKTTPFVVMFVLDTPEKNIIPLPDTIVLALTENVSPTKYKFDASHANVTTPDEGFDTLKLLIIVNRDIVNVYDELLEFVSSTTLSDPSGTGAPDAPPLVFDQCDVFPKSPDPPTQYLVDPALNVIPVTFPSFMEFDALHVAPGVKVRSLTLYPEIEFVPPPDFVIVALPPVVPHPKKIFLPYVELITRLDTVSVKPLLTRNVHPSDTVTVLKVALLVAINTPDAMLFEVPSAKVLTNRLLNVKPPTLRFLADAALLLMCIVLVLMFSVRLVVVFKLTTVPVPVISRVPDPIVRVRTFELLLENEVAVRLNPFMLNVPLVSVNTPHVRLSDSVLVDPAPLRVIAEVSVAPLVCIATAAPVSEITPVWVNTILAYELHDPATVNPADPANVRLPDDGADAVNDRHEDVASIVAT